jgi:murein DD-endopeptidase
MIQPPLGKPWLLYGVLGCSVALNLVMVLDRRADDTPIEPESVTLDEAAAQSPGAVVSVDAAAAPAVAPPPAAIPADWKVLDATVEHSLARTFQKAAGDDGNGLAAVYARLFVWDVDLRRDLQRGDRVEVAWHRDRKGAIEVIAARLHSKKLGRTLAAYRWQAPGDAFTSFWQEDGTEVPYRLKSAPLSDYEQITSLLKDRPSHAGMDFKLPVGTPVAAPFDGLVTRTNWNWKSNGNCVEIQYTDGTIAKFLHLSENRVEPNQRVSAGEIVALTGNTGRSTAPHLHYQLEKGSKVVDPLVYHGAVRRRVEGPALDSLMSETSRLDSVLSQALARR